MRRKGHEKIVRDNVSEKVAQRKAARKDTCVGTGCDDGLRGNGHGRSFRAITERASRFKLSLAGTDNEGIRGRESLEEKRVKKSFGRAR